MAFGRSEWGGRLVVLCALAGCGAQPLALTGEAGLPPPSVSMADAGTPPAIVDAAAPPASVDGGTDVGSVVRPARTTLLTNADLSTAEALAADRDGIYWVNSSNQLWMLPTGSDTPRELAADQNPPGVAFVPAVVVATGNDLFWSANATTPVGPEHRSLHRTRKTGGDVVLFSDFPCHPAQVAADDAYLYYTAYPYPSPPEVVAFPLDAEPGTVPLVLVQLPNNDVDATSLAVDDRYVYWNAFPVDTTIQLGEGRVFVAESARLLAGEVSYSQSLIGDITLLRPFGNELYFVGALSSGPLQVGRSDQNGIGSNLPLLGGNTLLVLDDWVVSALPEIPSPAGQLYAASAADVPGDGNRAVEIAGDVMVPPVIGPPGLVFVDDGGHLLAVSTQDLGAAVAAGQR